MFNSKLLSAPILLLLVAPNLFAQDATIDKPLIPVEATNQLAMATNLNDLTYSSPPTGVDNGVVVELSETESSGKARLTFPVHHGTVGLTFEAPIDKDTKRSDAIDENGFSNGVAFGADYTWFSLKWVKPREHLRAVHTEKLQACRAYFDQLRPEERTEILKSVREDPGKYNFSEDGLRLTMAGGTSETDALLDYRCNTDDLLVRMSESPRSRDVYTRWTQATRGVFLDKWTMPMLNVGAKLGVQDFDFVELDPTEETGVGEESAREEPRSLRVSAGILWGSATARDKVFWLTYQRSTSFKDAESAEICTPIGDSGLENCSDEPFGPPVKKEQDLLIAEFRTFICRGALALKAFYDLESEKSGGRAELFFIRNNEGSLTGGIGVEWDEEEGTSGSLFLTKGFNFGPS